MPQDAYSGPKKEEKAPEEKHGFLDNVKHMVGL